MLRLLLAGGIVVASFLAGTVTAQQPIKTFEGWGEVFDPDRDCTISNDAGKVLIKVPGTPHDFAAELSRWNSPRILTGMDGDFIMQVKIPGSLKVGSEGTIPNRKPYAAAGLMLVKDARNYVTLHRGAVYLGDGVRHYANFELRKEGVTTAFRNQTNFEDRDVWLRLERRGTKAAAQFSQDGFRWQDYDPIEIDFPKHVVAGVVAINSSKTPTEYKFENFELFLRVNEASGP